MRQTRKCVRCYTSVACATIIGCIRYHTEVRCSCATIYYILHILISHTFQAGGESVYRKISVLTQIYRKEIAFRISISNLLNVDQPQFEDSCSAKYFEKNSIALLGKVS